MSQIIIDELNAGELMSENVLCVYEGWTIQRLAEFFLKHDINGAPVIASDHQLVGAVSVSDIFKFENADDRTRIEAVRCCYRDNTGIDIASQADLEAWAKSAQTTCTVHQIMVKNVISVESSTSVSVVSGIMVDEHIHRLFVTDNGKIVGVISSLDMLKMMVPGASLSHASA